VKRLLFASLLLLPSIARADDRAASKGLYAEGGLGMTTMIGPGQADSKPGPDVQLRIGWDLAKFFSVGIQLGASSHEATTPPPPTGDWYQLYRGAADGRLGFQKGAVAFFAEGGLGAAYISSNVLEKVMITSPGQHLSVAFDAGGGLEYHIENRHYAFGVATDWWLAPFTVSSPMTGIDARLYLRYTADGL
jgi:hypothetical protein